MEFHQGILVLEAHMIRIYWNYVKLCFKVLFLLKDCKPFLKRENLLNKRRHQYIIRATQGKLKVERKTKGETQVNRQDMLIYLMAEAFQSSTDQELREELVDIFALLAICACGPKDELE